MALNPALERRLDQTVVHKAYGSSNTRGDVTFSTTAWTFKARIEAKQHHVAGPNGEDILAKTIVYVGPTSTGGTPAIVQHDQVTLPDNTTPPIMAVETFRDRSGVNHQVVHCG